MVARFISLENQPTKPDLLERAYALILSWPDEGEGENKTTENISTPTLPNNQPTTIDELGDYEMTTFDELYGGKFMKADDLPEEDLPLTIKDYELKSIGQDKEMKCILQFKELDKGLVLNKTNAGVIADLYGKEFDDWVGKRIAVYATEVDFQGKSTMAVRIRKRAPKRRDPEQALQELGYEPKQEPEY